MNPKAINHDNTSAEWTCCLKTGIIRKNGSVDPNMDDSKLGAQFWKSTNEVDQRSLRWPKKRQQPPRLPNTRRLSAQERRCLLVCKFEVTVMNLSEPVVMSACFLKSLVVCWCRAVLPRRPDPPLFTRAHGDQVEIGEPGNNTRNATSSSAHLLTDHRSSMLFGAPDGAAPSSSTLRAPTPFAPTTGLRERRIS